MSDEKKIVWLIKLEPELTIDDSQRLLTKNQKLEEEKSELENKNAEFNDLKKDFNTVNLRIDKFEDKFMDMVQKYNKLSKNKRTRIPEDPTLGAIGQ